MKICRLLLFGLLLLTSSRINAQTACPPGTIPYSTGNDPSACGPDPSQQQGAPVQRQAPEPPPQIWMDHYGAIATDGPGGSFGAAINMPNQSGAEDAALTDCRSKKGSSNCKVELWYINQCAAMVVGDTGHNAKAGTTTTAAVQAAMKVCNAEDNHCFVYYSACSLPTRIQ